MQEEYEMRVRLVDRMLTAFGVTDPERIKAVVDCTAGIPWLVPPAPGEEPTKRLLFALAVQGAALEQTFGAPGPGSIMQAAKKIAGTVTSASGHVAERRWVKAASFALLGTAESELLQLGSGKEG